MDQNRDWKATSRSATQEIPSFMEPRVRCRVHKIQPLNSYLIPTNPVHILSPISTARSLIHRNTSLPGSRQELHDSSPSATRFSRYESSILYKNNIINLPTSQDVLKITSLWQLWSCLSLNALCFSLIISCRLRLCLRRCFFPSCFWN
jgi:hypothetical protein